MVWLILGDCRIFSIVVSSAFCPIGVSSAISSWLDPWDELPPEDPPEELLPPEDPPDEPPEDPPEELPPDEPPEEPPLEDMPDPLLMPWLDAAPVVPCCPLEEPDALPPTGGSLPR